MLPFVCQSLNWDKTVGIHSSDYINVIWTWYDKRLKTCVCVCVCVCVFSVLHDLDYPHFVLLTYKLC